MTRQADTTEIDLEISGDVEHVFIAENGTSIGDAIYIIGPHDLEAMPFGEGQKEAGGGSGAAKGDGGGFSNSEGVALRVRSLGDSIFFKIEHHGSVIANFGPSAPQK